MGIHNTEAGATSESSTKKLKSSLEVGFSATVTASAEANFGVAKGKAEAKAGVSGSAGSEQET